MNSFTKNKLKTPGYFIKRLKDNGFIVIKLFKEYEQYTDPRAWTIMVNPGHHSVIITCYINRSDRDDVEFELNDGGRNMPKNIFLKTDSFEVVIEYLLSHNISNNDEWPDKIKYITYKSDK